MSVDSGILYDPNPPLRFLRSAEDVDECYVEIFFNDKGVFEVKLHPEDMKMTEAAKIFVDGINEYIREIGI